LVQTVKPQSDPQYKLFNEMGGAYGTMAERWRRFWWGILKQRAHLEDLGLDVRKE